MNFPEFPKQNRVKLLLEGMVRHGRIANGYLFCGPKNSGQYEYALALARALNCPGQLVLKPQGNYLKKSQIKEVVEQARFGADEGQWLVIIIDQAHLMTTEAANSFLKALEEPAPRTTYILITHNQEALLTTIVSRCQQISFNYIEREQVPAQFIDPYGLSWPERLKLAESFGNDKEQVRGSLDRLLRLALEKKDFGTTAAVLRGLQRLNFNVNVRLCLDELFLAIS